MPNHIPSVPPRRIYRSEKDRIIAGVAGGLGEYFMVDPLLIRIIFVILAVSIGVGFVLYVFCWFFIPTESEKHKTFEKNVEEGAQEFKAKAEAFAQEIRQSTKSQHLDAKTYWALILIVLGLLFLLTNFNILAWGILGRLWPILLIIIGWQALVNKKK